MKNISRIGRPRNRRAFLQAAFLAAIGGVSAASAFAAATKQDTMTTYTNPVIDRDMPDPGVLSTDGFYWMTHTMGGPDLGCPLYRSTDLVHWTFVSHLLTKENKAPWMQDSFWAPEIHRITHGRKHHFVLTFTAHSSVTGKLCIATAISDAVTGPYAMPSQPLVSDSVAVLDSDIFQDTDGKLYLIWKRDSETHNGVGGTIRLQELNADGTAFAPGSEPVILLTGDPETKDPAAAWERGLAEAPWMVRHGGYYYVVYSGAFIDTTYSLGVARSASITGPFVRCPGNPILRNNAAWGGPGHGAVVQDGAGAYWHVYHARHQDRPNDGRVLLLDRMYWTDDWPAFGEGGTPSFVPQAVPAPPPADH